MDTLATFAFHRVLDLILAEVRVNRPLTCKLSEAITTSYLDRLSVRAAQLNPVECHSPELLVPAPSPPAIVAKVAGTEPANTVPLAKVAQTYAVVTEVSFASKNGNAAADEAKNVMTSESPGLVSDTASKYHQSNTEPFIESIWGASRLNKVSISRSDVVVRMSKFALLSPSWTALGIW